MVEDFCWMPKQQLSNKDQQAKGILQVTSSYKSSMVWGRTSLKELISLCIRLFEHTMMGERPADQ